MAELTDGDCHQNMGETETELAIRALHDDFALPLERLAWSILRDWDLAADAVQEAFGLLATRWGDIAAEHRRGWLTKTVQYQAHNLRRKHSRLQTGAQAFSQLCLEASTRDNAQFLLRTEQIEEVMAAVAQLPSEQQHVFLARLREEKTFKEIAESQGVSLGTVLSRMRLALQKVRAALASEY